MSDFDERTLFDTLDQEPDPAFTDALLELLQAELADSTSHPSTETDPGVPPDPEVEIVMLQPNDTPNRRVLWFASAAAVIALVVGALALWPGDDREVITDRPPVDTETEVDDDAQQVPEPDADSEPETAPEPAADASPAAAVAAAEQFMDARAAHDLDAVQSLVATDATITQRTEGIDDAADYPGLIEWERIADVQFDDVTCDESSPGRVRCTYSMTTAMSTALGLDPWLNSFILDVDDGMVTGVTHNRSGTVDEPGNYHVAVFASHFGPWVDTTYPGDWEILTGEPTQPFDPRPLQFTDEALALWEIRIPEYVAHLQQEREALALEFVEARSAGDADRVRQTLAADVEITGTELITDPADYEALHRFEAIEGMRFDDYECDVDGGSVRCEYTMSTALSDAMGEGPWQRLFILAVVDGEIVEVRHLRWEPDPVGDPGYRQKVLTLGLAFWMEDQYPGEWDEMTITEYATAGGVRPINLDDESLALWEIRVPEFIASLTNG